MYVERRMWWFDLHSITNCEKMPKCVSVSTVLSFLSVWTYRQNNTILCTNCLKIQLISLWFLMDWFFERVTLSSTWEPTFKEIWYNMLAYLVKNCCSSSISEFQEKNFERLIRSKAIIWTLRVRGVTGFFYTYTEWPDSSMIYCVPY